MYKRATIRFNDFLVKHFETLKELYQDDFFTINELMSHFEWAWMNLCTRCFGHYHLPNEIAMVPLVDLINHENSTKESIVMFTTPSEIQHKLLDL